MAPQLGWEYLMQVKPDVWQTCDNIVYIPLFDNSEVLDDTGVIQRTEDLNLNENTLAKQSYTKVGVRNGLPCTTKECLRLEHCDSHNLSPYLKMLKLDSAL